jgi:hypothetical protein
MAGLLTPQRKPNKNRIIILEYYVEYAQLNLRVLAFLISLETNCSFIIQDLQFNADQAVILSKILYIIDIYSLSMLTTTKKLIYLSAKPYCLLFFQIYVLHAVFFVVVAAFFS